MRPIALLVVLLAGCGGGESGPPKACWSYHSEHVIGGNRVRKDGVTTSFAEAQNFFYSVKPEGLESAHVGMTHPVACEKLQ